jgi:hypothetical protein
VRITTLADIDNEWERIMGNPDNVIMSKDLEDRLNLEVISPNANNDIRLDPSCEFVFKDYSVTGNLLCFSGIASESTASYTISLPTVDACKLLNPSILESYRVYIASEKRDIVRTAIVATSGVDVMIQWQEGANTIVTLTFKAWAK